MVKLIGPCMSLQARGTLNNVITYAVLGQTCYAKTHFTPTNPNTNAQIGVRIMTKYLTAKWAELSTNEKAKFTTLAETLNLSPYHAWLTLNGKRWAKHQMPTIDPTSTEETDCSYFDLGVTKRGRFHDIEIKYPGMAQ